MRSAKKWHRRLWFESIKKPFGSREYYKGLLNVSILWNPEKYSMIKKYEMRRTG